MSNLPIQTDSIAQLSFEARPRRLDLVELLFLLSVLLAPLELKIVTSLTVYDLVTAGIAFLIFVGPRCLEFLPFKVILVVYFFLLFALLSTFRATHPVESLTQIMQFAFIFFVQLPVILTLTKSQFILRTSLYLFLIGGLAGAGWAMIFQQAQGAGRVLTFYSDNPNRLGYPTAYLLPFTLFFFSDNWRRKRYLLALVFTLPVFYILIWALAASASRSATLGTLVALMIFLSFRQGFKIDLRVPLRILFAAITIGLVGYLLYQANYFPNTLRERVERTLAFEETLVQDRTRLAVAGWRSFLESPFIGVGLDNFRYVAKEYEPSATNQLPHNIWIQFLAQIGLIGTLMFFILIVTWFVSLFRAQHIINQRSLRELLWAQIASMAAVMTIYLFLPIMDQRQYWLLYGLGLAVALDFLEKSPQPAAAPQRQPAILTPGQKSS